MAYDISLYGNRATDFIYPHSLTSTGNTINFNITLLPYLPTNRHIVYVGYGQDNYTGKYVIAHNLVGPGTYNINVPSQHFKKNNAYVVVEINTGDKDGKFVSGSFDHTIFLYHPNYKHYLYNVALPARTFPGETCTVEILPPKDIPSGGVTCDVDILYNKSVGRVYIAYGKKAGPLSFVCPDLATNSSMSLRITTKDKNGKVLGVVSQAVKIDTPTTTVEHSQSSTSTLIYPPVIYFSEDNKVTLSEGEPVKITGQSQNINDYMIIYAKQPCNVAEAVKDYTGINGHYDATRTDLHNKLLNNIQGNPNYYVLKPFDAETTFISQDELDPHSFYIKTPNTNDYTDIKDFYALQWFSGVEPGDLIYLYAIERGTIYTTTVYTQTTIVPDVNGKSKTDGYNWKCRKNNATYAYWNIRNNRSPYTEVTLAPTKLFFLLYRDIPATATFTLTTNTVLNYPPTLFVTTWSGYGGMNRTDGTYLTSLTTGPSNTFTYSVPVSFLHNAIAQGCASIYFRTHWGNNTNNQVQFKDKYLELEAYQKGSSTSIHDSVTVPSTDYSDNRYTNINNIPTSVMTPYVVIPPAVKPIELVLKNKTTRDMTISYSNPLYEQRTSSFTTYKDIGDLTFNVDKGDDANDYSILNAVLDEQGQEHQVDKTLDYETDEKRYLTYEKQMEIPYNILNNIKNTNHDNIHIDLNIQSINGERLNFKEITSNRVKLQIMLSNKGTNRARIIDCDSSTIEYNRPDYQISKIKIAKDAFIDNNYDTIHLLYNADKYDNGKPFNVENKKMLTKTGEILGKVGWRSLGNDRFGTCEFNSKTFEIASYANQIMTNKYKIRLCLENMEADSELYQPPTIIVFHRSMMRMGTNIDSIELMANHYGKVKPGEDIYYDIPQELYNINYDDYLTFVMGPGDVYPVDTPDITFTNAFIEVVEVNNFEDDIDKYTDAFTATINFFDQSLAHPASSNVDPVECVDIIMCCFDENKNLINKTSSKRRDIYNGKEFIYYTDRRWHSFVNEKYKTSTKYKKTYDMTFEIPSNTEYVCFIAFTYGDWHGNPTVYSMSNILTITPAQRDFMIEFVNPVPTIDTIDRFLYSNSDVNNPNIKLKLNAQKDSSITLTDNITDNGFNLAKDRFDREKWRVNPLIFSNNKLYGYEQPIFNPSDAYTLNNVLNTKAPLYNNIEYYNQWVQMYGKDAYRASNYNLDFLPVSLESNYTVYEDPADKFISNNAIPYIEIPANIAKYDRSQITLFIDADFGKNV